ncbi:hypothetical protein [Rhodanobacter geophilus]|uniref:Uncharacterized protein n=1 Tax=Rhodanobacter geophilus TaxID=3162488 RepID=A0ABV3QNW8_9GAMM
MPADDGTFFINGNPGQSRCHDSGFSGRTDAAGAVRLGHDWNAGAIGLGAEGGHAGLGIGCDFSRNFGIGASYDRCHGRPTLHGEKAGENIDMFPAFAEFRF